MSWNPLTVVYLAAEANCTAPIINGAQLSPLPAANLLLSGNTYEVKCTGTTLQLSGPANITCKNGTISPLPECKQGKLIVACYMSCC